MKKVIMLGGSAKRRFFKDDRNAEIWTCNGQQSGVLHWLPRVDRAFNLHKYELLKAYGYSFDSEADWVREHPETPFMTMDKWPKYLVPNWTNWQDFPWKDMAQKQPRGMYHCGTFDWLVAYAVHCGVKDITIHGVNLCLESSEPMSAQACLEYWCGYAEGKGCKVTMKPDATMFCYMQKNLTNLTYGIDDAPIYTDKRKDGMGGYDYRE
ncbi:MAG TPA: hypothetical protein VMT89_07175 [Candidatus Acidoferrales bacterium]|nr:hypothetical protein [Candidatus Acidoferrales bacterium]